VLKSFGFFNNRLKDGRIDMERKIKFGVIGLGLMGREFGSACLRWGHLLDAAARPEIVGVCDPNPAMQEWFRANVPSAKIFATDYRELLDSGEVEAIYCAVPHNLHEKMYVDIVEAGKHLMGEKPFGIDSGANAAILAAVARKPGLVVRGSSEFPFFPGCQRLVSWIREKKYGRLLEVRSGFHHSSDMDVTKPINWKRKVETNGEYGCMGDLGLHTHHIPLRVGWKPEKVYSTLTKYVDSRPDGVGGMAACTTWENAVLTCQARDAEGRAFPLYLETKRMAPGKTNSWFLEVYGLEGSAKFTTDDPQAFHYLETKGKEQAWSRIDVGSTPLFPGITGSIFEFGFSDAILQMWAAFMEEIAFPGGTKRANFFGCVTPEETRLSHSIMSAALRSHASGRAEPL
jgi:predicted dehydrogenase